MALLACISWTKSQNPHYSLELRAWLPNGWCILLYNVPIGAITKLDLFSPKTNARLVVFAGTVRYRNLT